MATSHHDSVSWTIRHIEYRAFFLAVEAGLEEDVADLLETAARWHRDWKARNAAAFTRRVEQMRNDVGLILTAETWTE